MRIFAPWWRTLTALRLAARELQRNPRQGALVVTMVSLAGVVLMAVGTVFASQQPTPDEQIRAELGQNQAWVNGSAFGGQPIQQDPTDAHTVVSVGDPSEWAGTGEPVDIPSLLPPGAEAIPVASSGGIVQTGDAATPVQYFAGKVWGPEFAGLYDLTEGAPPAAPDEVLLSPRAAEDLGVEVGDIVTLTNPDLTATVTGILAKDRAADSEFAVLSDASMLGDREQLDVTWYLPDLVPTWAQIQEWNSRGVVAYSRAVALNPPEVLYGPHTASDGIAPAMIATAGIGLFALALLAGSAFSVGFRRDRRRLALLAANGASRGSLTGVGVATGFLLGLVGGAVGAVVGLGAGWGLITYMRTFGGQSGENAVWGYHWSPWHGLAAIAFCALAGALSALIPASAASRLDVMSALRGARKPARPRRWMTWAGIALVAAGLGLSALSARIYDAALDLVDTGGETTRAAMILVAGFAAVFAGLALLSVSGLRLLSRLAAPGGLALRLAARDSARNSGRTVPVVAAIGATVAVATMLVIANDLDAQSYGVSRSYMAPLGDAVVQLDGYQGGDSDLAELEDSIRATLPDATITPVDAWPGNVDDPQAVVPALAIAEDQLCPFTGQTARERAEDSRCQRGLDFGAGASVAVGGSAALRAILGHDPSPDALETLNKGGVVGFDPAFVTDGVATIEFWDGAAGDYRQSGAIPAHARTVLAFFAEPEGGRTSSYDGLISPSTAADIGYPVQLSGIFIHDDGGIDAQQEAQLRAVAMRAQVGLWVERVEDQNSYVRDIALGALAVVLLVAGASTAVAIGLARSDARRDDFTLASLGASPSLARAAAGWQAAIIVGTALVIGIASGVIAAWVYAHSLVSVHFSPPWLGFLAVVIAVPAVVGLLAAAFTRPVRAIHYRLAA